MRVKFPHSPILHYAFSYWIEKINDKNNTLPLGKQICFTIVWGCAEILPSFFLTLFLVVQCICQLFQSGISLIALTILLEYCNKIYWLQYTTENRKCTDNWWPMSSTVMWSLFVNYFFFWLYWSILIKEDNWSFLMNFSTK